MARVKVRGFTVVRDALGASVVEVEVSPPETIKGVLETLVREYGRLKDVLCDSKTGEMASFMVRVNDELFSSTLDSDRPVKTGDEIAIIFPIGGG